MGEEPRTQQLTHDIEGTRHDLTRDVEALTEKVSPSRVVGRRVEATKQRTRSGFGRVRDSVMGTAHSAADSMQSGAGSVGNGVSSAGGGVADATSSAAATAKQQTQGNPLAAGLIAFGVGWLASSLLPATQKEAQAAQALEDAAREHGQPVAQKAAESGKEVAGALKEKGTEAVQQVKETAQSSASTVADEGRSSASTVAEEARPSH